MHADATRAPGRVGVLVLGMHRSGTSAVARALNLQGIPLCLPEDLMEPDEANSSGYWESRALMKFNDVLLAALGTDWRCPPAKIDPASRRLRAYAPRGRALLESTHPTPQWLWKDPRNCALLPFWRAALDIPLVAVVVLRHPLDIARSLGVRKEHIPADEALAMWERSMRSVLQGCADLPTLVVRYDDVLEDPPAWLETTSAHLSRHGVAMDVDADALRGFLTPELRHTRTERSFGPDDESTPEQRALWEVAGTTLGAHDRFQPPPLPRESRTTRAVLTRHLPHPAKRLAAVSYRELRRRGLPLPARHPRTVAR